MKNYADIELRTSDITPLSTESYTSVLSRAINLKGHYRTGENTLWLALLLHILDRCSGCVDLQVKNFLKRLIQHLIS